MGNGETQQGRLQTQQNQCLGVLVETPPSPSQSRSKKQEAITINIPTTTTLFLLILYHITPNNLLNNHTPYIVHSTSPRFLKLDPEPRSSETG